MNYLGKLLAFNTAIMFRLVLLIITLICCKNQETGTLCYWFYISLFSSHAEIIVMWYVLVRYIGTIKEDAHLS